MKEWAAAFLGVVIGSTLTLLVVFKIWPVLIIIGSILLLFAVVASLIVVTDGI